MGPPMKVGRCKTPPLLPLLPLTRPRGSRITPPKSQGRRSQRARLVMAVDLDDVRVTCGSDSDSADLGDVRDLGGAVDLGGGSGLGVTCADLAGVQWTWVAGSQINIIPIARILLC